MATKKKRAPSTRRSANVRKTIAEQNAAAAALDVTVPGSRRIEAPTGRKFTLETGHPVPASGGRAANCDFPFEIMAAGESFAIARREYGRCSYQLSKFRKSAIVKSEGRVYALRQQEDKNYRCYRLK